MATPLDARPGAQNSPVRVRVFRIDEGKVATVRMLSDAIGGILTHYAGGRSEYCKGNDCPDALHRRGSYWKGYVAAELFEPRPRHWIPIVLEITEALELDMRGRYARGQVWQLSRNPSSKRRHFPIVGMLIQEPTAQVLRAAFDVRPVLAHLYHTNEIALDRDNPTPAPVVLEVAVDGPPPPVPVAKRPDQLTADERAQILERLKAARQAAAQQA